MVKTRVRKGKSVGAYSRKSTYRRNIEYRLGLDMKKMMANPKNIAIEKDIQKIVKLNKPKEIDPTKLLSRCRYPKKIETEEEKEEFFTAYKHK